MQISNHVNLMQEQMFVAHQIEYPQNQATGKRREQTQIKQGQFKEFNLFDRILHMVTVDKAQQLAGVIWWEIIHTKFWPDLKLLILRIQ